MMVLSSCWVTSSWHTERSSKEREPVFYLKKDQSESLGTVHLGRWERRGVDTASGEATRLGMRTGVTGLANAWTPSCRSYGTAEVLSRGERATLM